MEQKKKTGMMNLGVYGWILSICVFCVYALSGCQNQTFSVLSQYYTEEVGWSTVQTSAIITISGLIVCIFQFVVGQLTKKKVSPHKLAAIGLIPSGVLFILCAFLKSNIIVFAIPFIIARVLAQTTSYQTNGVLISNWFPKKKGVVMGFVTMGIALAVTISTFLMGWGQSLLGVPGAYGIVGVLMIIVGIIMGFVLKDYPEDLGKFPDNDPTEVRQISNLRASDSPWTTKRVLTTKEFWFVGLSMSIMLFSAGFMTQIVPVVLTSGFSPADIPLLMTLVGVAAAVGSYIMGVVDTKVNTKVAIIVCQIAMIIMGALANTGVKWLVIVALVCLAIILGGGSNYIVSFVQGYWGSRNFKEVFTWMQPIATLVSSLAPVIIAWIAEKFGGYGAAFWFASILGVISLILILLVKPGFVHKKEEKWGVELTKLDF
ncbi:MAG: MFS transporter [Lachnospiraceae bacterium]|nr:MFS transporter [Lachnospiraceae bacterium]